MRTLKECQEMIDKAFRELQLPALPANLYDPIRYILQLGGKRIRPALVLMACNVFTENIRQAIYPALAIEVFHNFTLVHDDIMDNSVLRRNKPTVHMKWNQNIGILSGDAMVIKSYQLLSMIRPALMPQLFSLFSKTALEVCEGQQFDMDFEIKRNVSMSEYLKMIELKTSALISASLKTGAIIGGASEADAELIYEFGRNLGIAFQIQDDFLDLYADPLKFGKNIGNDIVANKKTMLWVQAMQSATGKSRTELMYWLLKEKFEPAEKIEAVRKIFDRLKVQEHVVQRIKHYHETGISYLNRIAVAPERKSELLKVTDFLLTRGK